MQKFFALVCVLCSMTFAKVYDCFTFFNELELLELRLNELNEVVDYFVIVEADKTFMYQDKEFIFEKNQEQFQKFLHKIIYVKVTDLTNDSGDPWPKEFHQRNCILRGLDNADDSDLVMISDIDEIPRASCFREMNAYFEKDPHTLLLAFKLRDFVFYMNVFMFNHLPPRNLVVTCKNAKKYEPWQLRKYREGRRYHPEGLRIIEINDAGWHFSFLGGFDQVFLKLNAYSHAPEWHMREDKEVLRERMQFDHIASIKRVCEIDESYPKYVLENLQKYEDLGFIYHKN